MDQRKHYPMKIVYYDHSGPEHQVGFRGGGSAWRISAEPDSERPWNEHFAEFSISERLYWSLFHLGIIDDFCKLPHYGLLGGHEEGILRSSGLANASELLRQRAENLIEGEYEWNCGKQFNPDQVEYKILVDAGVLRDELIAFADFLSESASQGLDVQLWL